jgi:hypothetical protein
MAPVQSMDLDSSEGISGPLGDHFAHVNAGMTTSADLSAERAFQGEAICMGFYSETI